jgi:ABC transporter DrrB family efflux protein
MQYKYMLSDTLVVAKRNLIKYKRVPQLLIFSSIQPVMMLFLFNFVFGGALMLPEGVDKYIDFLLPGLIVQVVLFGSTQATVAMAEDLSSGIIDRFKSLPMNRFAVVGGRALADLTRNAVVVSLMSIVGFGLGFRFGGSFLIGVSGFGLALLFSFAMSWISICIGLVAKDTESAQAAGFIWVFPLAFASSIFVPVETMPDWLQVFAENQPVSVIASAVRELTMGSGNYDHLIPALLWVSGIVIVFSNIANAIYKRS